jgi:hypothetical protein
MTVRIICLIILAGLINFAALAQTVVTHKEGLFLVTQGAIVPGNWFEKGRQTLFDLSKYQAWALKGLDGRDPVSAGYWENFKSIALLATKQLAVMYDLNLGWPFGSKNNRLLLDVDDAALAQGRISLRLAEKGVIVEELWLELRTELNQTDPSQNSLQFRLGIHFAGIIEPFIDRAKYDAHVNNLVKTLVHDLTEYCQSNLSNP